jgi:hypothetical protein
MPRVSKEVLAKLQPKMPQKINEVMARYCALLQEIKDRTNPIRLAVGKIVSVARVKPHAVIVAPRHDAKAVVLDLVQPFRPGWRPLSA